MITPNDKLVWKREFHHEQGLYWMYDVRLDKMYIKMHTGMDFFFLSAEAPHRQVYNVPYGDDCLEAYFGDPRVVSLEELNQAETPPTPSALLNCPFCGKGASITSTHRKSGPQSYTFGVGCSTTNCRGQAYRSPAYSSRGAALKAWNTRR